MKISAKRHNLSFVVFIVLLTFITSSVYASKNSPPVVDAGANQEITLPDDSVKLSASVSDDGLPDSPRVVTMLWSVVSNPGRVTIDNAYATDTTATFSDIGTYVLRLTADDGELQASDTVTIDVIGNEGGSKILSFYPSGFLSVGEGGETSGCQQSGGTTGQSGGTEGQTSTPAAPSIRCECHATEEPQVTVIDSTPGGCGSEVTTPMGGGVLRYTKCSILVRRLVKVCVEADICDATGQINMGFYFPYIQETCEEFLTGRACSVKSYPFPRLRL
ncbi:hypothetical protein ACFL96_02615 [Thermoproteota archaeon]